MIPIVKILDLNTSCPSQWYLVDPENQHYYVRYRYGMLRAYSGNFVLFERSMGDNMDGTMDANTMKKTVSSIFEFIELNDNDLCHCGSLLKHHSIGDNHDFNLAFKYDEETGDHVSIVLNSGISNI